MHIAFTQKFKKQVESCKDKLVRKKLISLIDEVAAADSLSSMRSIKKLKGSKNCYRLRVGDYRIGLILDQKTLIFAAFDHRANIYKYFP